MDFLIRVASMHVLFPRYNSSVLFMILRFYLRRRRIYVTSPFLYTGPMSCEINQNVNVDRTCHA